MCERQQGRYTKELIVFQVGLLPNTLFQVFAVVETIEQERIVADDKKNSEDNEVRGQAAKGEIHARRVLGGHPPFPHPLISSRRRYTLLALDD